MSTNRSYHLVNLLLFLFFVAVILASLLPPGQVDCQRLAAGLDCNGCGLSRSFHAILTGSDFPITVFGQRLFLFCAAQVIIRALVSFILKQGAKPKQVLIADASIFTLGMLYAFWPLTY